ncbi:MAG: hypothetical protein ACTS6G_05705 [Candidatus Hodgkinia cicadicola]
MTAASLGASPNAGSLSSASASTSGAQLHYPFACAKVSSLAPSLID